MSNQNNQVTKKLHTLTLAEFVQDQTVHTVKASDSLEAAVELLYSNRIHSAPVLAEGKCVGVIDMLDLLTHAVLVAPEKEELQTSNRKNKQEVLERAGRALALQTVGNVGGLSGKDTYVPLERDNEATLAVDMFATGVHRCPVVDETGTVVGTLSQSAIVRWLAEQATTHLKAFPGFDLPLAAAGLGQTEVVAVQKTADMIDVLSTVQTAGVSAVPVVDSEGALVGTFSATDLTAFWEEKLPSFGKSVQDFLAHNSPNSLTSDSLPAEGTTVRQVVAYFAEKPYHRVWITSNGKPTGVVSHTDLMCFLRDFKAE